MPTLEASLFPDCPLPAIHRRAIRNGHFVCACCGAEAEETDAVEIDGESICPNCVVTCPECETQHRRDSGDIAEIDGEFYCVDCTITCEHCGTIFPESSNEIALATDDNRGDDVYLCDDCATRCEDCGRRGTSVAIRYRNDHDEPICDRCSEHYCCCENCGDIVHDDNTRFVGEDGPYCESCAEEREEEEDTAIHDYNYKPGPEFYRAPEDRISRACELYLGIEIEAEAPQTAELEEDAKYVNESGEYYCKHDGSISYGFEIVSHPGTIAHWRGRDLSQFQNLRYGNYRSYNTTTCGMHVHVSRRALSMLDQLKLMAFFRENVSFIQWASRRRHDRLSQWAAIDRDPLRVQARKVKYSGGNSGRYVALNLTNSATIEFRIFRGTLYTDAIRRNLEFVYALCQYVKQAGLRDLSSAEFIRWCKYDGKRIIGKAASKSLATWFATRRGQDETEEITE